MIWKPDHNWMEYRKCREHSYYSAYLNQFVQSVPNLTVNGDLRPSGIVFRNRLKIILVLSSELDGATIYCGIGQHPRLANFTFKIYSKSI